MCGITGFLSLKHNSKNRLTYLIEQMSITIAHRGPDDSGVWADAENNVALGHQRLSILDLSSAGHQPMVSSTGRYIISFNGEINCNQKCL